MLGWGALIDGQGRRACSCNASLSSPRRSAINPAAHVSSAEQGHSAASRGTFLEIIKLTESSFLHALCHLRWSAAVNIIKLINTPGSGSPPASALRSLNVFLLVGTDTFMGGSYTHGPGETGKFKLGCLEETLGSRTSPWPVALIPFSRVGFGYLNISVLWRVNGRIEMS